MADEDEKVLTLIKHGGVIGGAATGSVLGFLAGGPIGAAIGGAVGATLQTVTTESVNRELSRREEMRVGGTASYAIDFIHERLQRGDRPREDKFFVKEKSGTSPAEEIFEGVLLKAKGDHEEQKARFYGVLFANVAFDPKLLPLRGELSSSRDGWANFSAARARQPVFGYRSFLSATF